MSSLRSRVAVNVVQDLNALETEQDRTWGMNYLIKLSTISSTIYRRVVQKILYFYSRVTAGSINLGV